MSPTIIHNNRSEINVHQQPEIVMTSKVHLPKPEFEYDNLHTSTKRKTIPSNEQEQSNHRYPLAKKSIPETIIHCSVNNPVYNSSMIQKSSTTHNIAKHQPLDLKSYQLLTSSSNKEIRSMDFRPLITYGRRKFGAIPPASSLIITKKKSPSPMTSVSSNQKSLTRSIPVDIISNNMAIVISSMIPSSLSYSSSYSSSSFSSSSSWSYSASASSTNIGTVFLPIQVTKSQNNNNNNNNNSIKYSNNTITNEGQRCYPYYVQNPSDQHRSSVLERTRNQIGGDDDIDPPRRISSSSSTGGEGNDCTSTLMMDSHVLRLIRRYDPVSSNTTGIQPHASLENTRNLWHTVVSKTESLPLFGSSPFLSRRSLTATEEDDMPIKRLSIPRIQRQQAVHDTEPSSTPPPPPPPPASSSATNPLRPILKYSSLRSRSEFIVDPRHDDPLKIDIPLSSNESAATYQPLITSGTKRSCSALSKSEWDLRLQPEQVPVRSPSPVTLNQPQEKESYRPVLVRSKSSIGLNNFYDEDDSQEISSPIIDNGSCVEKLKQLFVTKSSLDLTNPSIDNQHRTDSIESNLTRRVTPSVKLDVSSSLVKTTPLVNSIEPDQRKLHKPTIIVQDVTPTSMSLKRTPVLKSQKTLDSLESVNRPDNSNIMSPSELSHDTYRVYRLNDHDSMTTRSKNIAKVEPYSINTNTVRPLYSSSSLQPITMTTTTTTAVPSKARISLRSMENTSTDSLVASRGGTIRHPNVRQSDFLMPHPPYPTPTPSPPPLSNSPSYTTPPILLSESLSHGSLHPLSTVNSSSYNGRTTGLTSSINNAPQIYSSSAQSDFHSSMHTLNNHKLGQSTSYHYRPSSTTIIHNSRQKSELPIRSTIIEQPEELLSSGQQHQSRRRFQKRKQMKRSKSVDLYQEPSSFAPSSRNNDFNKSSRQQRSASREYLARGEDLSSSSSSTSSSSLAIDIERVNRAALLRYKSLDSMTFNNQKSNFTGRINNNSNNRRAMSKPTEFDFDSDDSVCGIPKSRRLCTSSKNAAKSEGTLLHSSTTEKDHRNSVQAISQQNIGSTGTHTGITNAVRKNETINDQVCPMVESTPSARNTISLSANGEREGDDIMQQTKSGISFTESQFYARSSNTPQSKRANVNSKKAEEFYSPPPPPPSSVDDIFQDASSAVRIDEDQKINDKVMRTNWNEEEKVSENQELFINESVNNNNSSPTIRATRSLSNTFVLNPFERLRPMDTPNKQYKSEEVSLQIFDQLPSLANQDDGQRKTSTESITLNRSIKSSGEQIQDQVDDTNDSSTSTTTSRSVHLPVEKQRGLSEIIRKRNSRYKVEDYKRSIQKSTTFDDQQQILASLPISKSDHELITLSNNLTSSSSDINSKQLNKTHSVDIPVSFQPTADNRAQLSIERLNVLLSNEDLRDTPNEVNDKLSVADKKSLFETFTKDTQITNTLPRSRSFKTEDSSPITNKYTNGNQRSVKEDSIEVPQSNEGSPEKKPEEETFDDDISKLSFKEKMVLFNKKKNLAGIPSSSSSSSKPNRSRLTQPITAEEVQAAANLTPSSSSKELAVPYPVIYDYLMHDNSPSFANDYLYSLLSISQENDQHVRYVNALNETNVSKPQESEILIPVSKRLEQFKVSGEGEFIKPTKTSEKLFTPQHEPKSTRKTPTLKYNAKKTNTDEQQRAKTIDIVRLKTDSAAKPKDTNQTSLSTNKTNGTTPTKTKNNVISVLKSDAVSVLKPDDHLDDFFTNISKNLNDELSLQLNTDDLNRIAENTVRLQSQAPRVRPPRRQQQGAKNPLRQIQANIPTENEYIEVHTNLSEQEVRRLKRAQIAENAGVAQEALAALAATENFAEINLRKIDESPVAKFGYEPYKDVMLILIKGRRQCSLRLVNPLYESVNEGDCYLLITPLKVFAWMGRYANTLEKARTTDIIDYLKQHRDFGLRNEVKYFILDQARDDTENDIHAEFRDMLQGEIDDYKLMDDVVDDEFYETNIVELNRVYRVENDLLMPLENFCFRSLSINILDPNEVFVFDFGAELYVWNGKYADKMKRNMGLQLAQQLWNDSFDYSECTINAFDPLDDQNEQTRQSGSSRPTWCIFGKQNQNVETLLFKGKFYDWPSDFDELKPVNDTTNNTNKIPSIQRPPSILETLKPADVHKMLDKQDNPVNLILEQVSLGRGRYWYDPVEMRAYDIQTISINVWHVSENERHELSKTSYGQFYSDDVYIIRWRYKLVSTISNTSSVQKPDTGRNRVAYWIWQGMNTSSNDKGISALMTVFFDEEKGPHIHVAQEHEEASFLQLFDGTLTIHVGKRNQSKEKQSTWRLYVFLGEIDVETHWWEVNVGSASLRSRTSFLLLNNHENLMLLWHGYGTTDEQQILANKSAMKLRERCPEEFHFDGSSEDIEFFEMQEGDEIELFWEGLNERNHQRKYHSLLNVHSNLKLSSTMRIFHLSSLHGPFVAQELLYPLRSPDHISSFPFTQSDLYELHQPALCLIDTNSELYIWQGWNDQIDDELSSQLSHANLVVRGPRDIRFTTERRCAFRTAIDYYKTKTGSSAVNIPCSIVYAGLEPIDFINLFPKWTVNMKARQQNQLEGKKLNQKDSVIDVLNQLCRDQYSIEELRARPLPEGVDPSKIESYLSDTDFQKEFRMAKDEFYALPYWKQTNIKKPLGFF